MSTITLRKNALLAAILMSSAVLSAAPAFAAAPMAKTPTPGFSRMMLGDFEVTALSDGTMNLPADKVLHASPAKVKKALAKSYLASPVETSVNAFLINTGSKLVLVDAGAGSFFGPTLGNLLTNLKISGYQPEQIDEIYITHMHPDHIGSLMLNGALAFPNAVVRADKHESDFWLSQAAMDKAPADVKVFFTDAMVSLNPYISAGKYKPFDGDTELVPGVRAVASRGHTPGHSSYVVESKGQKLVLVGDMIHVGAVQLDDPAVTINFDSDPKKASAVRQKDFAAVAKQGDLLGASHLPFPGLGHLRATGKGYQWLPLNYTQMR